MLFIIVFGTAMGGVISTLPIIVADLFGRAAFPSVLRYVSLFLLFELAGFILAGLSFDWYGSYEPAYAFFMVLDGLAALLILTARRPHRMG
jgi:MFS transporter, OFA family, oxalate/formate antiporter